MNKQVSKIIAIVTVCLCAGFFVGFKADQRRFDLTRNLDIFNALFKELDMYYVDTIKSEEVVRNGIDAMLMQLDPYTTYIPESEQEDFSTITTGEYGGVGSVIMQRGDTVFFSDPYEGSPSQLAGILAGDAILQIDGEDMIKKPSSQVSDKLRGEPETSLSVKVLRNSQPIDISITRKKILRNAVPYFGMYNDSIGYIYLSNFTDKAAKEVKAALLELKKNPDMKGLILDLRNNPGGILEDALNIVNYFVPKGTKILETKGKIKTWDKVYKTTQEPIDTILPLAVMINRGSASASEIVSGTLQDLDRAVIVGERSYGKGLVQSTRQLPYNGLVKITTAKYYIPSGRLIQAIDYSNRNPDGSVGRIPDSLTNVFRTASGREVRDGGGISPDMKIEPEQISNLALYLAHDFMIFDFATDYRMRNPSIGEIKDFRITDKDYEDFTRFIKKRDFKYDRQSEKVLAELKKVAEFEGYSEVAKEEFAALEAKFNHDIDRDLRTFRKEIEQMLSQEIVKRYYFEKGEIIISIQSDSTLMKASDILTSAEKYSDMLKAASAAKK